MKTLNNKKLLEHYLTKYKIPDYFDTKNLNFTLTAYDKGELINYIRDTSSYIQFLVKGNIQLYSLTDSGRKSPLSIIDPFCLLGDMEFSGETSLPFTMEASTQIICVELLINDIKEKLEHDIKFLHLVVKQLSVKLATIARIDSEYNSVEEKLLAYMKYGCRDHSINGMEHVSIHLRCSRRQLQRVLKKFLEQGIIEKEGKGKYRLTDKYL